MLLSNPDCSNVAFIYDTSRDGMHLWVVRKSHGVAELRYCGSGAAAWPAGVRLLAGAVCNRIGTGYHLPGGQIIVLF